MHRPPGPPIARHGSPLAVKARQPRERVIVDFRTGLATPFIASERSGFGSKSGFTGSSGRSTGRRAARRAREFGSASRFAAGYAPGRRTDALDGALPAEAKLGAAKT